MSGIHAMLLGGGGSSGSVTLNNASISFNDGANVTVGWKIDADGFVYQNINSSLTSLYRWTTESVALYEVRATVVSGDTPAGSAAGTWLACSTDREWTITDSTADVNIRSTRLTIEVRDSATLTVRASCTVELTAEKLGGGGG